ncbi:mll2134 [Mesorhizobium japonicum MAFF 303099]|uniref:Mll2134 protein n=1 Tax=Mesorhizobium japonicum (strain LMG 29417 / CECT 9101 / MAFF 303099) TaxID=266835 RepID=Q98J30_RHILO|nr:mll2134 [Mesorhizobium japonicum MAFF 303099]
MEPGHGKLQPRRTARDRPLAEGGAFGLEDRGGVQRAARQPGVTQRHHRHRPPQRHAGRDRLCQWPGDAAGRETRRRRKDNAQAGGRKAGKWQGQRRDGGAKARRRLCRRGRAQEQGAAQARFLAGLAADAPVRARSGRADRRWRSLSSGSAGAAAWTDRPPAAWRGDALHRLPVRSLPRAARPDAGRGSGKRPARRPARRRYAVLRHANQGAEKLLRLPPGAVSAAGLPVSLFRYLPALFGHAALHGPRLQPHRRATFGNQDAGHAGKAGEHLYRVGFGDLRGDRGTAGVERAAVDVTAPLDRPALQEICRVADAVDLLDLPFQADFERHSGFQRTHGVHLRSQRDYKARAYKRARPPRGCIAPASRAGGGVEPVMRAASRLHHQYALLPGSLAEGLEGGAWAATALDRQPDQPCGFEKGGCSLVGPLVSQCRLGVGHRADQHGLVVAKAQRNRHERRHRQTSPWHRRVITCRPAAGSISLRADMGPA